MKTIKQLVLEALVENRWVSGGEIEKYVMSKKAVKGTTVSRQLRAYAKIRIIKSRLTPKVKIKKYVEYHK